MKSAIYYAGVCFIFSITRRNIRFDPEDGFDSRCGCFCVKLNCAVQVAVIGYRYRVHSQFLDAFDQPIYSDCTIKQRIFAM